MVCERLFVNERRTYRTYKCEVFYDITTDIKSECSEGESFEIRKYLLSNGSETGTTQNCT